MREARPRAMTSPVDMLVRNLGWALGGRSRGVDEKGVLVVIDRSGEMWAFVVAIEVLTVEGRIRRSSFRDGFIGAVVAKDRLD